jgi:hypothetical protein
MGRNGYRFYYATTLCAFHFLSCALGIWVSQLVNKTVPVKMPFKWV